MVAAWLDCQLVDRSTINDGYPYVNQGCRIMIRAYAQAFTSYGLYSGNAFNNTSLPGLTSPCKSCGGGRQSHELFDNGHRQHIQKKMESLKNFDKFWNS